MNRVLAFLGLLLCPCFLLSGPIYEEIQPLPFDGVGYFAAEKTLDRLFKEHDIQTVVEIGCWAGASTRFLANRVGEYGKVYAVDHWLGTPEHPGEMQDPRRSIIYHLFLSNIRHFGLNDRVVPIRMSSEEALQALRHVVVDLVFLDGPRNREEVCDAVLGWYSHLSDCGVMCGTEWREQSVREGVQEAAQQLGMRIDHDRKGLTWTLY